MSELAGIQVRSRSRIPCSLVAIVLLGGKGTEFDSEIVDATRAKIDGGKVDPGYFTTKK